MNKNCTRTDFPTDSASTSESHDTTIKESGKGGMEGKSCMPVYGNQKQHEARYSRILTDITRTSEGNLFPCWQVGKRGVKVQIETKYSLAAQKQKDVGVCWK